MMKKLRFALLALFLMVCTAATAFADEVYPTEETTNMIWPTLLIAAAVIVIAVVLWKLLKRK